MSTACQNATRLSHVEQRWRSGHVEHKRVQSRGGSHFTLHRHDSLAPLQRSKPVALGKPALLLLLLLLRGRLAVVAPLRRRAAKLLRRHGCAGPEGGHKPSKLLLLLHWGRAAKRARGRAAKGSAPELAAAAALLLREALGLEPAKLGWRLHAVLRLGRWLEPAKLWLRRLHAVLLLHAILRLRLLLVAILLLWRLHAILLRGRLTPIRRLHTSAGILLLSTHVQAVMQHAVRAVAQHAARWAAAAAAAAPWRLVPQGLGRGDVGVCHHRLLREGKGARVVM